MKLGISSCLNHSSATEWADKMVALGLECVNFPINCDAGAEKISAYKKAADDAGLLIAEVGIWKNTLDTDLSERKKWIDYSVGQLQMADDIGAICAVNVVGTPYGPRWDGGYKENFSDECWQMAIKMIQQIIDTAKPKKAKFSIESMPWMIPSSPDEYVKMINDVNREEFGAHLDVVNMITSPQRYFYNSDFLKECFEKLKGKICSCHLKDVVLKPEFTFQLEETACGKGILDIELFAELATKENQNMPMIIEHLTTDQEYIESVKYVQKRLGL